MASESTEMYLSVIYRLTCKAERATVSEIASALGISLPSVSEKVKHLADQKLVLHEWREGVTLTARGTRIALKMLRKRRLIETFLVEMAGYELDEVHEDACRLEHAVSDRLADRLDAILGHPEMDPHGHPIPNRDGTVAQICYVPLSEFKPGAVLVCRRLECLIKPDGLSFLCDKGITPGARFRVEAVDEDTGAFTLRLRHARVEIAPELVESIRVTPVGTATARS
ncbi:MAG: metal-dependent transcriptional regulator [Acidobacteria bacterium]|nr:metal-dependent transcriptional regulator [Acidobacteriota bacterium]